MHTPQQEIEFNDLLKRNNKTINSLCLKFCGGNAFYFDELRLECALAIWTEFSHYGLDRFRGDSAESTWIYQISYHAIADYHRNPNHRELISVRDLYRLDSHIKTIINESIGDEEQLYGSKLISQALDDWNLLDELREHLDYSELNMLDHYLNDDSYSTIARAEGITENNARKRMSRLINKLKMLK